MKDSPWVAFWLPIVVIGFVALVLFGVGSLLLNIALMTGDWIPGIHSGVVIIVALGIGAIIVAATAFYALRPGPAGGEHPADHGHGATRPGGGEHTASH